MTILDEYVALFRRRLEQAITNPNEWYQGKTLYMPFTPAIYRHASQTWVGDVTEVERVVRAMLPAGIYAAVAEGYMRGEYMIQLVREPAHRVPSWS